MKKALFVLLIAVLVFSSLGCLANEVADYGKSLNLPLKVVETMSPLGKSGMDENEKALVDEIYFLPQEVQVSETALNPLSEIAQDRVVTSEELDRFKDLDQDGLSNQEELEQGTDLLNPDSDDDGLGDGEEILTHKTYPLRPDSDYDGLNDGDEVLVYGTNPLKEDSDGDTLNDQREILIYRSDPLDKNDPLNKDSDGDGVIDYEDPEPLKANSYKETVSWLSKEMKEDALSCINKADKVQTFRKLSSKVCENVHYAKGSWVKYRYPDAKWDPVDDWCKHPRDILMHYYSYHQKVQLPPDCDDIVCVYDIMADYIIEQTGWDEEGGKQGNNGVDCDLFPCICGSEHYVCVVNINGEEYVADSGKGSFFKLGRISGYKFPWDRGGNWCGPERILMVKFDKRYTDTIYNKDPANVGINNSQFYEMLRNQTPENEEKLEALYLKVAYQGD